MIVANTQCNCAKCNDLIFSGDYKFNYFNEFICFNCKRTQRQKQDCISMKKIALATMAFYGIIIALTITFSLSVKASSIEVTHYLKTSHYENGYIEKGVNYKYNENHNFMAVEYRSGNQGYSISSFITSHRRKALMVDAAYYIPANDSIEFSFRLGLSTGYSDHDFCVVDGSKLCPFVSASVAYTKYKMFIPKISILPTALALSFSTRF